MSTCYLTPMSHEWRSLPGSSEPLSPTTTAPLSRSITSPPHGLPLTSVGPADYANSTDMRWASDFTLRPTQNLVVPSSSPLTSVYSAAPFSPHAYEDIVLQGHNAREEQAYRPALPMQFLRPDTPAPVTGQGILNEEDEDDEGVSGSELEDIAEDEASSQTAAERRAAKRKMKRFRLTHSQTRFLLSEFARQPHPDAAQRERLSREIPGLSSRQVQVWFQNRRAKLKRLSVDDRERMMRSRALPEDFDRSSALRSGLSTTPQLGLNTAISLGYNPSIKGLQPGAFPGYEHIRRISDESAISPCSDPSMPSESLWTSGSVPESEMQSPVSPMMDRGPIWSTVALHNPSPQNINPHSRPHSFPANYPSQRQATRPQHEEYMSRMRTGPLAAPVPAGQMYTGGQAAEVPMLFGRPCPPATFRYSQRPLVGLESQGQCGYAGTQESVSPQLPSEKAEQLAERSPPFAYGRAEAQFAIHSSPSVSQTQQESHNRESSYRQSLSQKAPLMSPQEFQRPELSEQYARPPFSPHATHYSDQGRFTGPTSPQTMHPRDAPIYQMARASISGPILAEGVNTIDGHQQQSQMDAGRRRSFTHPPDYNNFR